MKSIFLSLAIAVAAFVMQGGAPADAASLTDARALAASTTSGAIAVGGCLDEGCQVDENYRGPRAEAEDDDADDGVEVVEAPRWRERAYGYAAPRRVWRGGDDFCWSCSRRCGDGYCPSECWGWWRQCRREGY